MISNQSYYNVILSLSRDSSPFALIFLKVFFRDQDQETKERLN